MKLAILGADAATIELARAALASHAHTLDWVCEIERHSDTERHGDFAGHGDSDARLRSLAHSARLAEHWESLLDQKLIDAVIVGRAPDEDRRAEQLRKFVQVGMPILVSHPVVDSMLIYYELDMIRRETRSIVLPYLPDRLHPAIARLAAMAAAEESAIGKAEQMVMERPLGDRSRAQVLAQFARDVDLIRAVTGEVSRIGAMGAATAEVSFANLGVQMSGPSGVLARWSVGPLEGGEAARISLLGVRGKATLHMPAAGPWTLAIGTGPAEDRGDFVVWDPARAALAQLAEAVAGKAVQPDWVDAARSVELAETIERSLRKGRNVDLHYEEYTEQGTFKGMMTSLGCGLLIGGLTLVFVVALVDNVARAMKRPIPLLDLWPYFLLGLLGLFLLLQFLSLLFAKDEPPETPPPEV